MKFTGSVSWAQARWGAAHSKGGSYLHTWQQDQVCVIPTNEELLIARDSVETVLSTPQDTVAKHADVHQFTTLLIARRLRRDVEHERRRLSLNELIREPTRNGTGSD